MLRNMLRMKCKCFSKGKRKVTYLELAEAMANNAWRKDQEYRKGMRALMNKWIDAGKPLPAAK